MILAFILGGLCGFITTAILASKAIREAENEMVTRCMKDTQRSFGRTWKGEQI